MLTILSSDRIILPFRHRKRQRGRRITLTYGRGAVLAPDGSIDHWVDEEWQPNFLADEGEQSVLNVYFLEAANVSKYLALLTATPIDTTTEATMTEVFAPPLNGYARQQINAVDWGAPALDSGDYMTTAAQKTFGPAATNPWTALTYVALVSTATGTAGKFLSAIALSGSTSIAIGQSFLYTMSQKAQ